jgi:hypothetical protein
MVPLAFTIIISSSNSRSSSIGLLFTTTTTIVEFYGKFIYICFQVFTAVADLTVVFFGVSAIYTA